MNERDIQQLSETLVQVRLDIRELMTEVRSLKDLHETVSDHETRVTALEQSYKSAHHRLNKVDKIIFWVSTVVIGGVIVALLGTLWNK